STMLLLLLSLLLPSSFLGESLNSPENPWGEYAAQCRADEPSLWDESRIEQKWYKIDLNKEEHERWREVAEDFTPQISATVDLVKAIVYQVGGDTAVDALLDLVKDTPDKLTEPYRTEIKAMADLTGIQIEELTLLNLFYELGLACTSLVAIDYDGRVFHGRNLDFGLFFLWNTEEHMWELTRKLKGMVAQFEFYKDGKSLFKGVTFAGHLGILTGVRKGAFSVSLNSRFGGSADLLAKFFADGLDPNQQFVMYAIRDMLTNYDNFDDAKSYMETEQFMICAYITMGHPKGGIVISRSETGPDHEAVTDVRLENGWYVLQTNYDWNEPDIYLDDRTIPGNKCMQKLGRKRVTKEGIFQVMSSKTTLNKSTVYTTVMEIDTGAVYTFKQKCDDPCWFV
ncbi:hypothetical protein PMAYCL1PPCAC_15452, partial [Pristionchus mayeri]